MPKPSLTAPPPPCGQLRAARTFGRVRLASGILRGIAPHNAPAQQNTFAHSVTSPLHFPRSLPRRRRPIGCERGADGQLGASEAPT
eukprot:6460600-Pyramimonas_sp.AAC.1